MPTENLVVYTIAVRAKDGAKLWIRVGSAVRERDGQISVALDALPTNGTLVIRPASLPPAPTETP